MPLNVGFRAVEPSIVAFTPLYERSDQYEGFPKILGTGFIVGDGVIATNDHVVRAFSTLPKPPNTPEDEWPARANMFRQLPEGMAMVPLEVLGVATVDIEVAGYYYGEERPDLAFVFVKAKGLPAADISSDALPLEPGVPIATAGFTMGTDTLRAPGWIHQMVPTLQSGIISAVLPFRCSKPHGVMINIMTQGGASGSPVFDPDTGTVVGVLYGGLNERSIALNAPVRLDLPTNFSYFVPAHYLESATERMKAEGRFGAPEGAPTLDELIRSMQRHIPPPQEHLRRRDREIIVPNSEA